MSDQSNNIVIPSVNDRVNNLLQSYALKIHLIAELIYTYYEPLQNIRKKIIDISLIKHFIKDVIASTQDDKWQDFYKFYSSKENNISKNVEQLIVNMRDSRVGVPILTDLSKSVYETEPTIKRYLPLFIIEEVFNKWSDKKKETVPKELLKLYSEYALKKDDSKFEELASRLLNKMFFSSILVGKIVEELIFRLFDINNVNIDDFKEFKLYKEHPQVFMIYMEEKEAHSSNPFYFNLLKKENGAIKIEKTTFRTHLLVSNYILNNCNNNDFVLYILNTNKEYANKIENDISKTHKTLIKGLYRL